MKRINDTNKLETYLEKHHIRDCFDTKNLPFFLVKYERGEMLVQPLQPLDSLLFVVSGTFSLYSVRQNGSVFYMSSDDKFVLLGDMEFVNDQFTVFYAEAKTDVFVVCLSVSRNRAALNQDLRFLHYLLDSLAWKMHQAAVNETSFPNLEERLLHYLAFNCQNQTLTHIEHTAENLHCSRRQLQRILKKLVDEGRLSRDGKGIYRLKTMREV